MVGKPEMSMSLTLKSAYRSASKRERKMRLQIQAAHDAGKKKRAAYLTSRYLNSYDAKFVATVNAYRKLKPHRKAPSIKLKQIAENLDPWRGTQEEVILHWKQKKSNDAEHRPIMDFGLENRSLQYLVKSVLSVQVNLSPCQFAINGGRSAASEAVLEALGQGYTWISEIDIENFFPSVNGVKLTTLLSLPPEVTNHVVTSTHLNILPGNIIRLFGYGSASEWKGEEFDPVTTALSEARLGLAQGSASSSLVCEMLLEPVISGLPDYGKAVSYADNILIMARDKGDGVAMIKTLGHALLGHPAGPFLPIQIHPLGNNKEFDFLGYTFSRQFGECTAAPSAFNLGKFHYLLERDLESLNEPSLSPATKRKIVQNLRRYVSSWTAAFSLWAESDEARKYALALIKHAAIKHAAS